MEVGRTIGSCRLPLVGRAINPSFAISVFCTNRGLGNFARSRWGDIGGLMGIRRNEANLWAGGFRGIGGPDQGVRRKRGCLPHWRNEANFGGNQCWGGSYGSGEWREVGAKRVDGGAGVSKFLFGGSGGGFGGGEAGLLECLEPGEGCLVGFFEEGDAAVEPHEDVAGVVEAFAEGGAVAAGSVGGVEFPEVGFGAEEAAERPFVAEKGIDVEALFGRLGRKAGEVFDLEAVEIGAVLAIAELGIGVEAGFESVLRRHSFAFRGARTRGFLRVEAIGLDLTEGCHKGSLNGNGTGPGEGPSRFQGSRRECGVQGFKIVSD